MFLVHWTLITCIFELIRTARRLRKKGRRHGQYCFTSFFVCLLRIKWKFYWNIFSERFQHLKGIFRLMFFNALIEYLISNVDKDAMLQKIRYNIPFINFTSSFTQTNSGNIVIEKNWIVQKNNLDFRLYALIKRVDLSPLRLCLLKSF